MTDERKLPVVAVVGPTAAGKSALALRMAERLNAEIVCMDSMQIYRRMDIGTAKPTPEERRRVAHHLLDIAEPTEDFSVSEYASRAQTVLRAIHARGRTPLLVGGTGFYLKALTDGLSLGGAKGDASVRERLEAEGQADGGKEALHQRLRDVDPTTAARLHPNDVRRVVRALEVYELTGKPFSAQRNDASDSPFRFLVLGVTLPRERLYERIESRVDAMLRAGLVQEVRALLQSGVSAQTQAMQGIGYKELVSVIENDTPLAEAAETIKRNTRHYAKRQLTWFRGDARTRWLDATDADRALACAEAFLRDSAMEERNA